MIDTVALPQVGQFMFTLNKMDNIIHEMLQSTHGKWTMSIGW